MHLWRGGGRHFDQQLYVYGAYIWGNKAKSQPLILCGLEHIPPESFDLWSASGQLTPDCTRTRVNTFAHTRVSFHSHREDDKWLGRIPHGTVTEQPINAVRNPKHFSALVRELSSHIKM